MKRLQRLWCRLFGHSYGFDFWLDSGPMYVCSVCGREATEGAVFKH